MTLTAADVAEIMRLVEQSRFDELNLEIDGIKLTLRRAGASGEFVPSVTTQPVACAPQRRAGRSDARRAAHAPLRRRSTRISRTSHRRCSAHSTGRRSQDPRRSWRSARRCDEDSVIAIIEVMKLMNTVRAGVKGVITEILPADETLVEFGEVLMRVRKDA